MLHEGMIFYEAATPSFYSFRPPTQLIFSVAVAFLTTILSYQSAATLIDLFFGLKQRGVVRRTDLQLYHLMHSRSPLAILHRFTPGPPRSICHPKRMGIRVKLFCVLAIAPLCNIFTLVLTLEYDQRLTFAQAGVGGIALFVQNDPRKTVNRGERRVLTRIKIKEVEGDDPTVHFFSMLGPKMFSYEDPQQSIATIEVFAKKGYEVYVRVKVPTGNTWIIHNMQAIIWRTKSISVSFSDGQGKGSKYFLRHRVDNSMLEKFLDFGVYGTNMLGEWCGHTRPAYQKLLPSEDEVGQMDAFAGRRIACEPITYVNIGAVIDRMMDKVEIAESAKLELVNSNSLPEGKEGYSSAFFEPEKLGYIFVRRRRSYASFLVLTVLFCAAILLRLFTALMTNNDLSVAMLLIVRHVLGLPWSDSMLACDHVSVRYGEDLASIEVARDSTGLKMF